VPGTGERQVGGIDTGVPLDARTNEVRSVWRTMDGPEPVEGVEQVVLRARAWDGRAWSAPVTSETFMVDNEPPSPPPGLRSTSHSAGTWATNSRMTLAWEPADDGGGIGVNRYGYTWVRDPGDAPLYAAVTTNLGATGEPLADGDDWWARAVAIDVFGNASTGTHVGPFRIDTTPPDSTAATVLLEVGSNGAYTVGSVIGASWTGFSDALSGVQGYYYGLQDRGGTDEGSWTAGTGAAVSNAVLDRVNAVYVWPRDNAGLIGAAAHAEVLVLDPGTDYDGDGLLTGEEEMVGTDAADPGSAFHLHLPRSANDAGGKRIVLIRWSSVPGLLYTLYCRESLTDGGWTPVPGATDLPGTGGIMEHPDLRDVRSRWYLLIAREP
jgi:hypothetical protein